MARDLHWKDFFFPESTETKEIHAKPLDSFKQAGSIPDKATILVDLKAPNDVIVAAFREWLKVARLRLDNQKQIKFFSDSFRHRCIEQRVLQYIDVTNWNIWKGNELKYAQAGAILFPEYIRSGDDLGERIRKTVRPLADKMMDWDVLVGLEYQVLDELKSSRE